MSEPDKQTHVPYVGDDQAEVLYLRSKINGVVLWFNSHVHELPDGPRERLRLLLERAGKGL